MMESTVSHYRIVEKLGGGGMGVIHKAEDLKLGQYVALRFLPEGLTRSQESLERFQREARAASALNHPNICTLYDVDEFENQPFIAMELLEGVARKEQIAAPAAVYSSDKGSGKAAAKEVQSSPGTTMGTVACMPPEQVRGEELAGEALVLNGRLTQP